MKQLVYAIFVLAAATSCGGETTPEKVIPEWNQEKSTAMNKDFAVEEDLNIQLFLSQHESWKVEATGSGLRYIRLKEGKGPLAKAGQEAKVQYVVTQLDGKECYRTPADEVEIFRIDKSNIETGIQEGIKKMQVGEKAKLIVPSHLAHGLIGDLDKIPPLTTLVVDIELLEIL